MEVSKEIYLTLELTKNEARTLLAMIGNQNGELGYELFGLLIRTAPELKDELDEAAIFSAGALNFSETENRLRKAGFKLS